MNGCMISELDIEAFSTAAPKLRYVTCSLNILLCFVPILYIPGPLIKCSWFTILKYEEKRHLLGGLKVFV